MADGNKSMVTFKNGADRTLTCITELPTDTTPRFRFSMPRDGTHTERVPGADALTYEQLRFVEGEDENGTKTNATVSTDQLRHLGGFKLTVTRTDDGSYQLTEEDMRRPSLVRRFSNLFRRNDDQLPTQV